MSRIEVRTVDVLRYLKPLREGGSLPAIVQASDEFLYVLKFKGAGQGKSSRNWFKRTRNSFYES